MQKFLQKSGLAANVSHTGKHINAKIKKIHRKYHAAVAPAQPGAGLNAVGAGTLSPRYTSFSRHVRSADMYHTEKKIMNIQYTHQNMRIGSQPK